MMKLKPVVLFLAVLSLAALGCRIGIPVARPMNNPPPITTPPFDYATIHHIPDEAYYGDSCADDQPTQFTVKAQLVAGARIPDQVLLKWAYVMPDGTVKPWAEAPMTVGSTTDVYEATIFLDAAAVNAVMNGANGDITYEVEAIYDQMSSHSTFGFGGELIRLVFCGDE